MQRHGGRTRPLVSASAKPVVTPSHDSACDDSAGDERRADERAAPAETKE
jgi:hypothetical protein